MDKTSLAIALLVVIILLLCAPQTERPRALGRIAVFAGIGLAVYGIVPILLALWFGAISRYGGPTVFVAVLFIASIPLLYFGVRQDFRENREIRSGSQEAFDARVNVYITKCGYNHERAVEATLRIRDGDKMTISPQANTIQKEAQGAVIRPAEPDYEAKANAVSNAVANPPYAGAITGIGGWLLLLIIRLWIGAVIRAIGGLATGLSLMGILSFGYAALAGVAAYLLGRKSAKGVMAAKIYLVADALYYALSLLDSMIGDATPQLSSSFPPWFKPSGYLIASVLWIVYLARSERVKNTYSLPDAEVAQEPSRRSGWSS
jgi:hypothetical protein